MRKESERMGNNGKGWDRMGMDRKEWKRKEWRKKNGKEWEEMGRNLEEMVKQKPVQNQVQNCAKLHHRQVADVG